MKIQCTVIETLKTVQKLSVEWRTLHTLSKRHIDDVAKIVLCQDLLTFQNGGRG